METYIVKVDEDGTRGWYQNDKLHRLDGPAIERINGDHEWWQNGRRHRLDGPAIEFVNGRYREWYIEGKYFTEEQFNQKTQKTACEDKQVIIDGIKYRLVKE